MSNGRIPPQFMSQLPSPVGGFNQRWSAPMERQDPSIQPFSVNTSGYFQNEGMSYNKMARGYPASFPGSFNSQPVASPWPKKDDLSWYYLGTGPVTFDPMANRTGTLIYNGGGNTVEPRFFQNKPYEDGTFFLGNNAGVSIRTTRKPYVPPVVDSMGYRGSFRSTSFPGAVRDELQF